MTQGRPDPSRSSAPESAREGRPPETVVSETVVSGPSPSVSVERSGDRPRGGRELFATREGALQESAPPSPTLKRVLAFTWLGVVGLVVYGLFIGLALFNPGYALWDRIASILLGLGLLYIIVHGLGYANSMIKASVAYDPIRRAFSPQSSPKIACVVTSFNEPPQVLEETVAALTYLDYPNKEITILDDSTRDDIRQAVRDIAARYGVAVRQRTNRRGYKAGAINDFLTTTDAPFLAIFDADCLPAHNFLRDIVPILDENPKLAFVQTPQFYANTDVSSVALAASRQQSVFYEYICEGKDRSRAMFCCGTNFVIRRDALLSVGGFDESNVTEDFATSLNLHAKGYDSAYYNQIYVYGLGPETLSAYFTQQSRWAFGSVGQGKRVLASAFKGLKFGQWWEYFLSSTYYWIGWVNFIFLLLPMLYIFFGIQPLRSDVFTYLAVFIPYLLFTMNMFYAGLEARGYGVGDVITGQQLGYAAFPVHMSSALSGLLGLKRPFGVTPKGEGGRMNWLRLWPQILFMVLSLIAFALGIYRYVTGIDRNTSAVLINSLWALYNAYMLSGVFKLNRPVRDSSKAPYFAPANTTTGGARAAGTVGSIARGPEEGRDAAPRSVFQPVNAQGGIVGRAPKFPQRRSNRLGPVYLALTILTLFIVGLTGLSVANWYRQPFIDRDVLIVDRTTGRDYQEHRALVWTLNFLKVRKTKEFNPSGSEARAQATNYDYATDYYGHLPGDASKAQPDPYRQGDLLVEGRDRALPATIDPSKLVYLSDTYGEFVEYDYGLRKYVYYRDERRGLTPDDVDTLEDFARAGGLIAGEWNTLGYPTLPGNDQISTGRKFIEQLPGVQGYLNYLQNVELKRTQADLARAQRLFNRYGAPITSYLNEAQKNVLVAQDRIEEQKSELARVQQEVRKAAQAEEQLEAQKRLERLMHVRYTGWYGRYVDNFAQEQEFDVRLYKNVYYFGSAEFADRSGGTRQFPGKPTGPGFVFYRDGPTRRMPDPTDPKRAPEDNPFSRPVIITAADIAEGQTSLLAGIYRTTKNDVTQVENNRLLRGIGDAIPCRYWFDVVLPSEGASVPASYKLTVKSAAIKRLREAGFPPQLLSEKTENGETVAQISFPAAVAYREGSRKNAPSSGALRSFYFAGDASDYSLVSRFNEMFPATGGISRTLGRRAGPFQTQFYWNFYQPMLRNVLQEPSGGPSQDAENAANSRNTDFGAGNSVGNVANTAGNVAASAGNVAGAAENVATAAGNTVSNATP